MVTCVSCLAPCFISNVRAFVGYSVHYLERGTYTYMTYYINPIWFYLMSVSNGIKIFLFVLGGFSLMISVVALISWAVDVVGTELDDDDKKIFKLLRKIIIASIISFTIGILTPSKETCVEMMIASQITQENARATKEEIYEIVDYIVDKVNGDKEGANE